MNRLQDKVAIVTGGASGIGAAAVRVFAEEGALVMCGDIDVARGEAVVEAVRAQGGQAAFHRTDIGQVSDIESLVDATVQRFGRLDVLFANAAMQIAKNMVDTTEEDYDRLMGVNLKGCFFCCRYAVQQMLRNGGGSIVATSSVNALAAEPDLAAYCASKGGIISMIKSIATDYSPQGIRANCLCPGYVDTPLGDVYFDAQPDPAAERKKAGDLHLVKRIGTAEEIARCAVFLCSDDAAFLTGSAMLVDGGLMAKV